MERVLYFSHKCNHSRALLDRLQVRDDLLASLRFVDCTHMVTDHTGSKFFAVRDGGTKLEIPMMISQLPAIDFIMPAGAKYKPPMIGLEKISDHLGLTNNMTAAPRPVVVASAAASAEEEESAAAAAAAPRFPAPHDAHAAAHAHFVPSAPSASLARP